ncbi:uncharacterized protein LOC132791511 isoform X1 [Drosophila nasuta]|uniref:uncharacterized protein LOC132791511 isoform X1 n=1 Tax=Drosophila nasuta TaxID=42062 RepID=UPI00295EBE90|nr:uncharacterized protein LOC132791511 isoform X1 [Drosophila nasuta]XP_060656445.1 uncharacterized protein LOC132791511 isoform X1 [Drosophila nasuta]XP_060656446.1 uncharacterized protein LOC132791511 isoform X1 [Drosophila nasuta]XP_060656447.1 uncharacterized protein LOC132791511 isoform X1 [Drosophila nasuta]
MTEVEQPPQNGIDPTAGDDDENSKARPADIEQDMREMERRKRVEAIMGSKLFREELERIVDSARDGGAGASGILQQLSDIVGVPVTRVGNVFKSSSCMVPINDIRGVESMGYAKGEKILRCKLAATFRLLDLYGWTQGLGAQITARLKVDQEYFLVNPYGLLYHEITASALNKVDMQGQIVEQGTTNFGVNKSHFVLHSVVHAARPDIRCAIYIGCSPVVAISSLKSGLLALTKDACVLGEISTHAYTGLFDEEERNRLVRSLGPNSKVMLLANHGALCCGETIEEAFYAACHIVQACETQLKLLPVGIDNLVLIPEESRKLIYDQSRRPPEDLEKKFAAVTTDEDAAAAASKEEAAPPKIGSPPKWRVGGAEFEALMRMLDNAGYRTGYIYRHPLIKSDPPKPKNDVELPPAVSSLGYLLEEEELFRQGIWKKGDLRKGGDRSRWLNSPNVYQKVEVLETGTPDPKKITKWVAEGSPTHSTPVRIEDPLQFVPAGTTTKEFKRVQQQIKDNRRADKISAGPQSHILEGVTWDEANRIKDATVSQAGDHVVLMGAASKGIIQRGFQHNATVYKAPYAKNPFDNVTDDELNEYKRTVERKKKSIHGEYTDTDFSESEALNSMQAAGAHAHAKHAQSEPETEHQVIQIQTQQAPIPSQAEVVLSDEAQIQDQANHDSVSNQKMLNSVEGQPMKPSAEEQEAAHRLQTQSSCRRDLSIAFHNPNSNSSKMTQPNPSPSPSVSATDLTQQRLADPQAAAPLLIMRDLYPYAYLAAYLGRCCQPEICSALLRAIHSEHLPCYRSGGQRSSTTSSTVTTPNTNESSPSHKTLQLVNNVPAPYRTCSHFGFNSPRQTPRTAHRHMPDGTERIHYRPMQRHISYEEIFATPRYEQLCQPCFEHLLRLKPEIRRRAGPGSSSGGDYPDDLISCGSSLMTPRKLTTLTETNDEHLDNYVERASCHAGTQTDGSFLRQLERFNFSEESTNTNYGSRLLLSDLSLAGFQSSCSRAASATSEPPLRALAGRGLESKATVTDITEVWNFGNWQQEPAEEETPRGQEPLTEHRITLEITQQFNAAEEQQAAEAFERQLMSRDERQRRKCEFQELWQDHVQYFGSKSAMEEDIPDGWLRSLHNGGEVAEIIEEPIGEEADRDEKETHLVAVEELPVMLQKFEQSLCVVQDNLGRLVAATQKLQGDIGREGLALEVTEGNGTLYRSISLENIPAAEDGAIVSEQPQSMNSSTEAEEEEQAEFELPTENEHEEKRDVEKPVSPLSERKDIAKDDIECIEDDEKEIDEHECPIEIVNSVEQQTEHPPETATPACPARDNAIFSPLEREILERIEADRLKERESIFGRIDESIRNKLTCAKLRNIASDVEETFSTCTHIFRSPPKTPSNSAAIGSESPHLFQFSSEPRPSTYTMHNIDAPSCSTAHLHVIRGEAPRLSRSWASYRESSERSSSSPTSSAASQPSVDSSTKTTKTFHYRSTPRKKRNFIQENIRNASKPRVLPKPASSSAEYTRKNRNQAAFNNDPSSVCTFQAEERGSGARLWVSLPVSPRGILCSKRRSVSPGPSATYPTSHSSCSPYGKRRKQIGIHMPKGRRNANSRNALQKCLSSSTFLSEICEMNSLHQATSTSTFDVNLKEDDTLIPVQEEVPAINLNKTDSTLYYSANDSSLPEGQGKTVLELGRNHMKTTRLSGGETTDSASQVDMEEETDAAEVTAEEYVENTSYTGEISEHSLNEEMDLPEANATPSGDAETTEETDGEILQEEENSTHEDPEENSEAIENRIQADSQPSSSDALPTSSMENVTIALGFRVLAPSQDIIIIDKDSEISSNVAENECDNPTSELVELQEEEDEVSSMIQVVESGSSAYMLKPGNAQFKLSFSKPSQSSEDYETESSSTNREFLLTTNRDLQQTSEQENSEDDDNKPNTSAAAAKKRKSRKKKANAHVDSEIVLNTQCKIIGGTLHISEDHLDDIQSPRNINRENDLNPFIDLQDWNIFENALEEEELNITDDELEIEVDLDIDSSEEHLTINLTSNQLQLSGEDTLEIDISLGSYNNFGQLQLELDEGLFVRSSPTENDLIFPEYFDFGSFTLECSISECPSNDDSSSGKSQCLEETQNETNHLIHMEEEIKNKNESDVNSK